MRHQTAVVSILVLLLHWPGRGRQLKKSSKSDDRKQALKMAKELEEVEREAGKGP
jgi:hypothetical protein